jgi:hypothetical protein
MLEIQQRPNIPKEDKLSSCVFHEHLLLHTLFYDIEKIHYCFLVVPLEENKECVYYWGEFTEINTECVKENILSNKIRYFGVPVSDNHLKKYKVFGTCAWSIIQEKYMN